MDEHEWMNNLDCREADSEAEAACADVIAEIRRQRDEIKRLLKDKNNKETPVTMGALAKACGADLNTLGKWLRAPPKKMQTRTLKNLSAAIAFPEIARLAKIALNKVAKAKIARVHGIGDVECAYAPSRWSDQHKWALRRSRKTRRRPI